MDATHVNHWRFIRFAFPSVPVRRLKCRSCHHHDEGERPTMRKILVRMAVDLLKLLIGSTVMVGNNNVIKIDVRDCIRARDT